MSETKETICSLALGHLGAEPITSLNEASRNAVACLAAYESTKQSVLRSHYWNFAIKRVKLTPNGTIPPFGYQHTFALPNDYLIGKFIDNSFDIKQEGLFLLSDSTAINLLYISSTVAESTFDPSFVMALSFKLASVIGFKITQNVSLSTSMNNMYSDAIREAKHNNAIAQTPDGLVINTFTTVRM